MVWYFYHLLLVCLAWYWSLYICYWSVRHGTGICTICYRSVLHGTGTGICTICYWSVLHGTGTGIGLSCMVLVFVFVTGLSYMILVFVLFVTGLQYLRVCMIIPLVLTKQSDLEYINATPKCTCGYNIFVSFVFLILASNQRVR